MGINIAHMYKQNCERRQTVRVVPPKASARAALLRIEQRVQALHDVIDRRLVPLKFCVEQDEQRVDRTRETTPGFR